MLPSLLAAAAMAFLAGATDVYGLARLHDLFVSFMSGNTTTLGVALARGDAARGLEIAALLGLFVGGAASGAVLDVLAGRRRTGFVALFVAVLLAVPLAYPDWAVPAFVVAMGALNGAMTRVGRASVGLTYVTGALVKFGQGLGHALCGDLQGGDWAWQLPMWLSLLGGAVAATLVQARLGTDAAWPLSASALAVALGALALGPD